MLQTILLVTVVQLDIYSDKLLSFPPLPIAHIFAIKKQDMSDFSFIPPTSVATIPGTYASAAFTTKTSEVFKEENDIAPIFISERMKYIPWGGDNRMSYNIINLIESDETLSTCQMFNAEVCYGSGLVYNTEQATEQVRSEVDDFTSGNDIASYFLGVCQDFKHFGFCVSVIILNEDASRIVRIVRKQACYVRFAPADKSGVIPYILYANWRNTVSPEDIERISAIEFSILRIGEYPIPSIIDIVNSIRLAKGYIFAEWKYSETAKLFEDHGYKNKKHAGGYFF